MICGIRRQCNEYKILLIDQITPYSNFKLYISKRYKEFFLSYWSYIIFVWINRKLTTENALLRYDLLNRNLMMVFYSSVKSIGGDM